MNPTKTLPATRSSSTPTTATSPEHLDNLPAAMSGSSPISETLREPSASQDQSVVDPQARHVLAGPTSHDHASIDTQSKRVVGPSSGDQVIPDTQGCRVAGKTSNGHVPGDTQKPPAVGEGGSSNQTALGAQTTTDAATALVQLAAATLTDFESQRVAFENRLRTFDRPADDYGWGLGDSPERARFVLLLDACKQLEHQATLELQRAVRKHPLGAFFEDMIGVGEKQGARLIAAVGDPTWNSAEDRRRRGPAELWAYCGYAPSQRKRRGERAAWNHEAKMRAFLIAEKCIMFNGGENKNGVAKPLSPYRVLYDQAKAHYAEAVHVEECPRCGPKGKPAQPGSPLSDGHKHARALRKVAKQLLKDMFNAWPEAA